MATALFDDVTVPVKVITTLRAEPRGKAAIRNWVLDERGQEWLYKVVSPGEAYAEFIGHALAGLVGLPVPLGGSVGDERVWLSERIGGVTMWDEAASQHLTNPTDLGRMLALDAVLAVGDRHANNVLLQYLAEDQAKLWVIDYDGSGLRNPEAMVGVSGALPVLGHVTGLPSGARQWALEAWGQLRRCVDSEVLDQLLAMARVRFGSVDVELGDHVLRARLRDGQRIVRAYLDRVLV